MNILRDAMEVEGASIILNEYETETKLIKKVRKLAVHHQKRPISWVTGLIGWLR